MDSCAVQRFKQGTKASVGARATKERAAAGKRHAVPKEMLYKKSLRERCANGSCPGARRGLWLEGLEAAEGYFRKRYGKQGGTRGQVRESVQRSEGGD